MGNLSDSGLSDRLKLDPTVLNLENPHWHLGTNCFFSRQIHRCRKACHSRYLFLTLRATCATRTGAFHSRLYYSDAHVAKLMVARSDPMIKYSILVCHFLERLREYLGDYV